MDISLDVTDVPLLGWGVVTGMAAVAVVFLVLTLLLWRRHRVWRWVTGSLFVLVLLASVGNGVNTHFSYWPTVGDALQIPKYASADGPLTGPGAKPQPDGAVIDMTIPDTASGFGSFPAKAYLPPQYFTDPTARFPVMILVAGNPGDPTNWFGAPRANLVGLKVAQSGKPVVLVMPQALRDTSLGESLCLDTAAQGNAETYLTQDVVKAVDAQLRTVPDAAHRGIGGMSMGGYCALNLGLKHPDLFSVAVDLSGQTHPVTDLLPGGLPALLGDGWQQKSDANDPRKYLATLDGRKGPALWMDVGTGDPDTLAAMTALAPQLQAKGYTVELHSRPGGHDFQTWADGLAEALPWAANRFSP